MSPCTAASSPQINLRSSKRKAQKESSDFLEGTGQLYAGYCKLCMYTLVISHLWGFLGSRKQSTQMNSTGFNLFNWSTCQLGFFYESQLAGGRPVDCVAQLRSCTSANWNKSNWWSKQDLNSGLPDFKSRALTTLPYCLYVVMDSCKLE